MPKEEKKKITIEIRASVYELLAVPSGGTNGNPANVTGVIEELVDHAQQGIYRPGAWEREWPCQALGYEWTDRTEARPDSPMFQRPKTQHRI
jgi:hypothetical protein